jgi:cobalamin biosynthesis protein CobD/CbiB
VRASPRLPSGTAGSALAAVSLLFSLSLEKKEKYKNKKIAVKKAMTAIPSRTFSV